jgi:hypothetical protein
MEKDSKGDKNKKNICNNECHCHNLDDFEQKIIKDTLESVVELYPEFDKLREEIINYIKEKKNSYVHTLYEKVKINDIYCYKNSNGYLYDSHINIIGIWKNSKHIFFKKFD